MLTIRRKEFVTYSTTADTTSKIIAEIFVDNVSELPESEGVFGYTLFQGSIAYVISAGELYVMGGDGKWYSSENGTEAVVSEQTASPLIATAPLKLNPTMEENEDESLQDA